MPIRDWFNKKKIRSPKQPTSKRTVPVGIWSKCADCNKIIYQKELFDNHFVCPECGHHYRLSAWQRIKLLTDPETFRETESGLSAKDPLKFKAGKTYAASLARAKKKSRLKEAVITGRGKINGVTVGLAVMDFNFIGGSMGSAVGEKIVRLIELSIAEKLPLIIVTSSGGARMQEGVFSLMQMAKTSAAIGRYQRFGLPYISILTNPTMGGVTASFASLADIIIAEPQALIGFAGPRIIEQTIKKKIPEGFQSSESMLKNGQIDMVVERGRLKSTVSTLLAMLTLGEAANA